MKTSKIVFSLVLVLLLITVLDHEVFSQCSMCKKSAEDGGRAGGINMGIVYLGTIPYILFSVIAFLWYKNIRKEGDPSNLFGFIRKKLAE